MNLMLGDCLERMKEIPDGSVDLILADPPYGTTACKWDSIVPLEPMWEQLKRIIKPNGAIVMTASQPFTTTLIASNMKMFKYCWVFGKSLPVGHGYAKYRPMSNHEDIVVFSNGGGKTPYNPQKTPREKPRTYTRKSASLSGSSSMTSHDGETRILDGKNPTTIQMFNTSIQRGKVHPTEKPVALMEYLIRTYTQEGETVLDFVMGSGTTGLAAKNLNRNFIGIEKDAGYFEIGTKRILEIT